MVEELVYSKAKYEANHNVQSIQFSMSIWANGVSPFRRVGFVSQCTCMRWILYRSNKFCDGASAFFNLISIAKMFHFQWVHITNAVKQVRTFKQHSIVVYKIKANDKQCSLVNECMKEHHLKENQRFRLDKFVQTYSSLCFSGSFVWFIQYIITLFASRAKISLLFAILEILWHKSDSRTWGKGLRNCGVCTNHAGRYTSTDATNSTDSTDSTVTKWRLDIFSCFYCYFYYCYMCLHWLQPYQKWMEYC